MFKEQDEPSADFKSEDIEVIEDDL